MPAGESTGMVPTSVSLRGTGHDRTATTNGRVATSGEPLLTVAGEILLAAGRPHPSSGCRKVMRTPDREELPTGVPRRASA